MGHFYLSRESNLKVIRLKLGHSRLSPTLRLLGPALQPGFHQHISLSLKTHTRAQNGVFDLILDTSSPQSDDKQDWRRNVRHIALICSHEDWVKVTYDWSTNLCVCLCLCRPSFHQSKLRHKHKHKKSELVRFSCAYMLMSTQFSLAYTCACTYSYAYAFALVKTSLMHPSQRDLRLKKIQLE